MFNLSNIGPRQGARKVAKRVGRGAASGLGKTSGKGTKGQKSRVSPDMPRGFEGGQMPLHRRLPKRGFKNPFRKKYAVVNVGDLNEAKAGTVIDAAYLAAAGLLPKDQADGIKILASGDLKVALKFKINKISKSAQKKIEAAGGSVELIG